MCTVICRSNISEYLFLRLHYNSSAELLLKFSLKIIKKNPNDWFLLGRIYFVEGKLDKSIEAYNQAALLDPNNEQIYYGLGLSYGYLNDYTFAEKHFQKYLDIIEQKKKSGEYTTHPSGHWAGYNDLAWVYFLQGNFAEAEKVTREALGKYNNPWLLNMMGAILLNQNKKEEANMYFHRAKEYTTLINSNDFGEAYTGDSPQWRERGFANMKEIIEENIQKSTQEDVLPKQQ